jgi:hypothetical protein
MTLVRKLHDVRSGTYRHTNLANEIDSDHPKTTLRDVLVCIGIGVVATGFIYWMITVGH